MRDKGWGGWNPISPDEIEREEREAKRKLARAYRLVGNDIYNGDLSDSTASYLAEICNGRAEKIEREMEAECDKNR